MNYYINPAVLTAVFTVPTDVADKHLKLARGEHIKVLLYILRNMSGELSEEEISAASGVSPYDVKEALIYWSQAGILLKKDGTAAVTKQFKKPTASVLAQKPTRNDVARRGAEDGKIRYLLQETQMRLGRNLKTNESSTLVWLYDDQGLDVSVILMIIQYAVANNKANIRFIESTAVSWINKGIDSVAAADEELRNMALKDEAWRIVKKAFGFENRKPSPKESELSLKWVNEWGMSEKMLTEAYNACVDKKSRFYMPYVTKIIENWHEKGYKKPEDIPTKKKSKTNDGFAAYDMDLFEKMLNSKD